MFCFQCQETAGGKGCTVKGVCGKSGDVAGLQDLLIWTTKGLAFVAHETLSGRELSRQEAADFVCENLFMTITNANFDPAAISARIGATIEYREALKAGARALPRLPEAAQWTPASEGEYAQKAEAAGVLAEADEDIRSLISLTTLGLKGMAAYLHHDQALEYEDIEIDDFVLKTMAFLADPVRDSGLLTHLVLETGANGYKAMALLDEANTESFGNPEITSVPLGTRANPGILVSGHDLRDLVELLEQTEGSGVDVYTHSEMLPAHYYPRLKAFKHLAGNYGSSWWHQKEEFESFNGPILMTTNCIVPPPESASYKARLFTTGAAGYPGAVHIRDRKEGEQKDFSVIINLAKTCKPPTQLETGTIVGGFAHHQTIALADKVVAAVKSGAIRKFVVMGGCDGRMRNREYYTEFANKLPGDTVILTAGCAKYRYNKLALGDIGGIPRVLDAGQCNDSYSLVAIAVALKDAFGLASVNDLPLAFNIAWYEQKAVIVLLALLSLGVKNIHLGPTLPAFLSANVAKLLVEKFGIGGVTTADADLAALMA
jgi:hydroxylamine reductase